MGKWVTTVKIVWHFLLESTVDLPYNPISSHSWVFVYLRKENLWSHKSLYMDVYSSSVHNHHTLESAQLSLSE